MEISFFDRIDGKLDVLVGEVIDEGIDPVVFDHWYIVVVDGKKIFVSSRGGITQAEYHWEK